MAAGLDTWHLAAPEQRPFAPRPRPPSFIRSAADQPTMGKLDRAVGFVCLTLAGFAGIAGIAGMRAAQSSETAWAAGLASTPSMVSLILSLLAAIPGFFLVFRKGVV